MPALYSFAMTRTGTGSPDFSANTRNRCNESSDDASSRKTISPGNRASPRRHSNNPSRNGAELYTGIASETSVMAGGSRQQGCRAAAQHIQPDLERVTGQPYQARIAGSHASHVTQRTANHRVVRKMHGRIAKSCTLEDVRQTCLIKMEQVPRQVITGIVAPEEARPKTAPIRYLNEQAAAWIQRGGKFRQQPQRLRMMFQHVPQEDHIVTP